MIGVDLYNYISSCRFETQNVVPDIVTVAKPMGNGHPVGAVGKIHNYTPNQLKFNAINVFILQL